jgi:hypothetical protein
MSYSHSRILDIQIQDNKSDDDNLMTPNIAGIEYYNN